MELQCHIPYEVFKAGETAVFRIFGVKSLLNQSDLIVFAQVHGHMQLSEKWIKSASKVLDLNIQEHSMASLDQVNMLPLDPTPSKLCFAEKSSKCVYSTTKIALSPFVLVEEGFLLECEIPMDVLPTYRGRGIQVNYYISFYLQSAEKSSTYHFPITVNGQGSKSNPFTIKYVIMLIYLLKYNIFIKNFCSFQSIGTVELWHIHSCHCHRNHS